MEKEQAYHDAAKNYENAWKFGNQNTPGIGKFLISYNEIYKHHWNKALMIGS